MSDTTSKVGKAHPFCSEWGHQLGLRKLPTNLQSDVKINKNIMHCICCYIYILAIIHTVFIFFMYAYQIC